MKNTKTGATLKNGLTKEQVNKAYGLFSKVNLSECCRKAGVNLSTVYNVLRDESPKVDDLKKVIVEANRELKRKERTVNSLPL